MFRVPDFLFPYYNRAMQRSANVLFRRVLTTPPIAADPTAQTVLYSLLRSQDRRAYILMAKSILRYCRPLRVVVQDDGTLDGASCSEIQAHIPNVEIVSLESAHDLIRKEAPAELLSLLPDILDSQQSGSKLIALKLLNVLYRFKRTKLIMIDSDIVCLRTPQYIIDWMEEEEPPAFYTGGGNNQKQDFYDLGFDFRHADIGNFNSGLVGMRPDVQDEELIEIITTIATAKPELFRGWEIEQSIWAVLYGRRSGSVNVEEQDSKFVLSGWRTYEQMKAEATFVHFVGAIRFQDGKYARLARDVCRELSAS